jgi:DNA repair exonuclease SbcCD ATPase subunit
MTNYRQVLEQRKGQQKQILEQLDYSRAHLETLNAEKLNLEQAQTIIQLVAQATQEELKYHVSELVTLALASVFDNPYELDIVFVQRRNQTEADIWFVRDGNRIHPLSASGGGSVDVAAFALRIALWSLQSPRTCPVFILDEPFQHIKGDEDNIKAIQMVKAVSERLKLQIIMVSDERVPLAEIEAGADKVFKLGLRNGVTYIMK